MNPVNEYRIGGSYKEVRKNVHTGIARPTRDIDRKLYMKKYTNLKMLLTNADKVRWQKMEKKVTT